MNTLHIQRPWQAGAPGSLYMVAVVDGLPSAIQLPTHDEKGRKGRTCAYDFRLVDGEF